MIRPNPGPSEVLVFSPYLVHGGGKNFGSCTRVSLEMRFFRRRPSSCS
jgi:ectoine hydroxylase-related dioxygenase (phytanoyl-CoA dioxygenase family)